MADFSGSALYLQWVSGAGTVTLSGDFRQFSISEGYNKIDTSAGADAWETNLTGIKNFTASYSAIYQVGGTALEDALAIGSFGTVYAGPEGTASGKRKYTLPSRVSSVDISQPYNDIVEISVSWDGNGAPTLGTY